MKISKIHLTNFKRFTNLQIDSIPESSKLVLLIGSNGSGKSSLFDAFDWVSKGLNKGLPYSKDDTENYYWKDNKTEPTARIELFGKDNIVKKGSGIISGGDLANKFIGRSSIRIVPRITNHANPPQVAIDLDSPISYIENDTRFINDVFVYIQQINNALREPVFSGIQADTLKIFREFIDPLNQSLLNIFGSNEATTIQIAEFQDATPNTAAKLIFRKGNSKINYDLLSHGEKQIIILLLNFIVRQEYYKDTIIFIDEMDAHLNTKLQYNAIKEITENWISENSQLWTASHALGFIEYANDFEKGIVLDFDDLDFDKPQIIQPSDKNNYQIFELAVGREFIEKVFHGNTIIFAEETDAPLYNNLGFENTFFFDGKDKLGAFQKAKNLNQKAIIDRDYLSDEEIRELKNIYPFLYILPYYCIENLFYHPDNLEEYYQIKKIDFDKVAYINAIVKEKEDKLLNIVGGIAKARDGYPFYKENEHDKNLKKFKENYRAIIDLIKGNDFESFYKVFSAKDYGKTINQRQNLHKKDLSKTRWFKTQIGTALGMGK